MPKQQPRIKDPPNYVEKVQSLASLQTFPAAAFLEDSQCPAAVCRFVLALAVVHNDLNDVQFCYGLHQTVVPKGSVKLTREWALSNAIGLHLARLRIAIVHELLQIVRESEPATTSPIFLKLVKKLPSREQEAWSEIQATVGDKPRSTELGKFLAHCRDTAANHYGLKAIHAAFKSRFEQGSKTPPLISRGNSANSTRFYFADAAVDELVTGGARRAIAHEFFTDQAFRDSIDSTLYFLVTRFVELRGHAWRNVVEGSDVPQA
jgi:hypothetical protein